MLTDAERKKLGLPEGERTKDGGVNYDVATLVEASGVWSERPARYKIEVLLTHHRTSEILVGSLRLWRSGGKQHGGGDRAMWFCGYDPFKLGVDGCGLPIEEDMVQGGVVLCPHCRRAQLQHEDARREQKALHQASGGSGEEVDNMPLVSESKLFRVRVAPLARYVAHLWDGLKGDADVYVKHRRRPMRYDQTHMSSSGLLRHLELARSDKEHSIYTAGRIVQDTKNGRALWSAIAGFIRS